MRKQAGSKTIKNPTPGKGSKVGQEKKSTDKSSKSTVSKQKSPKAAGSASQPIQIGGTTYVPADFAGAVGPGKPSRLATKKIKVEQPEPEEDVTVISDTEEPPAEERAETPAKKVTVEKKSGKTGESQDYASLYMFLYELKYLPNLLLILNNNISVFPLHNCIRPINCTY